jgi:signal transduction histidine kinase
MARSWSVIPRPLRTIRFRLALQYLLALIAILVIVCYVVLDRWEAYVRSEFDSLLLEEAHTLAEALGPDFEAAPDLALLPRDQPPTSPLKFSWLFFEVAGEDGSVLRRSENLPAGVLPTIDRAGQTERSHEPVYETVTVEPGALPLAQSRRIRLLTLHRTGPGGDSYYLNVAGSLYPVEASVRRLRMLFLVTIPIGLLVAAMISWFLAGRALAPMGRVASQAEQYTAAHLDQRIALHSADDEIAHLVQVINAMLDRLETAFRAQERFIADASHELKTPLSVLLAESQILEQKSRSGEEYEQFVSSAQDQLRHLTRLIDSLLTLARADAGFPLSKVEPVSVNDIVTEATQRCEALARHRLIRLVPKLTLPTEKGIEPVVEGDRSLLRTVIENLVRNAVRYSPLEDAVEIEVALDAESVTVAVRDNGPGIPPDQIDRVFNRFFQIPRGDQTAQGAGLGLAIAKGVVQLHRGSISVQNRPTGGCAFAVRLPLKPG